MTARQAGQRSGRKVNCFTVRRLAALTINIRQRNKQQGVEQRQTLGGPREARQGEGGPCGGEGELGGNMNT